MITTSEQKTFDNLKNTINVKELILKKIINYIWEKYYDEEYWIKIEFKVCRPKKLYIKSSSNKINKENYFQQKLNQKPDKFILSELINNFIKAYIKNGKFSNAYKNYINNQSITINDCGTSLWVIKIMKYMNIKTSGTDAKNKSKNEWYRQRYHKGIMTQKGNIARFEEEITNLIDEYL